MAPDTLGDVLDPEKELAELQETKRFLDVILGDKKLYPYQEAGVHWLRQKESCILADDMGLGKSIQALLAISPLHGLRIVCPASLIGSWQRELAIWRPDLTLCEDRFPAPGRVSVSSFGKLDDDLSKPKSLLAVIIDEAQLIKKARTKQGRRARNLLRRAVQRILLTGTPVLGTPKDLWSLLQAIKLGTKLFVSWEKYMALCGGAQNMLGQVHWSAKRINPEAMTRLMPYVLRRTKDEVLAEMPPKTREFVELGTKEDYSGISSDPYEMFTARKQLAYSKAQHICPFEFDLVFSAHTEPLKLFPYPIIDGSVSKKRRTQLVADYQDGAYPGLSLTIGAGGVGLTLTRASRVAMIDSDWSPDLNAQAEDRVHRIGQTQPVHITYFYADHPVDKRVKSLIKTKCGIIAKTTGALNRRGQWATLEETIKWLTI